MEHMDFSITEFISAEIARFEPAFVKYGLLLVFVAVMIEGAGIPAPGQTVLIVGAVLAGRGQIGIVSLIVTAWSACVLGNTIGFMLGRHGGTRLLAWFAIKQQRLERIQDMLGRYGILFLIAARFVDGLKQSAGIISGALRMGPATFLVGTLIGSTLWVAVYGLGSYYLDRDYTVIIAGLHHASPWLWAVSGLLLAALFTWLLRGRLWSRRR